MTDVHVDDAAVMAMLDDGLGPVGRLLDELAGQAAQVARAVVPVRTDPPWSSRSDTRPPGFTKARIRTAHGHSGTGRLWASVNAPFDPAAFLEYPREDRSKEPFLTTGLWSLEGTI